MWYFIPALSEGSYSYIKLVAKKGNIPTDVTDGDKIITLEEPQSVTRLGTVTVTGLDELSQYYFVIFVEDDSGMTASSEAVDCTTGELLAIFKEEVVVEKKPAKKNPPKGKE